MEKHRVIYLLHADTKHYHLDLVVNRVDPDTEKVMLLSRSFDLHLSAEHGFRINNPELQQQIQQAASTSRTKMVLEERDREE